MKVLCVNASIDAESGGGTAERTLKLARYLQSAGVKTVILTTETGMNRCLINNLKDTDVVLYTLPVLISRYQIPLFNPTTLINIIGSVDIVHLMNHWSPINTIVYCICRRLRKPYVVCPAGALPIFGRSRLLKRVYNIVVGKNILRNAGGLIAIPANEVDQFEPYGISPTKITVIPNGINPDDFSEKNDSAFRAKHGLGDKPFILFVGRLNVIKGPDLLLHAFAESSQRFPDHQLVYAGPDNGMLKTLKEIACNRKIEGRVHFIGYVGGKEKSWAFHAADLLVVPSRQEAMSIVAIEAGITGTPVIITDVCGLNRIGSIQAGIVVPATVDGLKKGLSVLGVPQKLNVMGRNFKRFVEENHTWDSVVLRHINLFKQVIISA